MQITLSVPIPISETILKQKSYVRFSIDIFLVSMGDVNIYFDTYRFVNRPSMISKGKTRESSNGVFSRLQNAKTAREPRSVPRANVYMKILTQI